MGGSQQGAPSTGGPTCTDSFCRTRCLWPPRYARTFGPKHDLPLSPKRQSQKEILPKPTGCWPRSSPTTTDVEQNCYPQPACASPNPDSNESPQSVAPSVSCRTTSAPWLQARMLAGYPVVGLAPWQTMTGIAHCCPPTRSLDSLFTFRFLFVTAPLHHPRLAIQRTTLLPQSWLAKTAHDLEFVNPHASLPDC